jgi:hypothetical protein
MPARTLFGRSRARSYWPCLSQPRRPRGRSHWCHFFPIFSSSEPKQYFAERGTSCCGVPFCWHHTRGRATDWSCFMMPLRRYFVFVGGLLLGLLFLIDWYAPQTTAQSADPAPLDRSTIRVHSAHRWPSAVVFDTTQPVIAPPLQPVLAEAMPAATPLPAARKPLHEALALAQAGEVPAAVIAHAAPPKPVKRRIRTARPVYSSRVASSEPFGFRPLFPPSW